MPLIGGGTKEAALYGVVGSPIRGILAVGVAGNVADIRRRTPISNDENVAV